MGNNADKDTTAPDYHFSFSNDNLRLKFTINSDGFRAIKFQTDTIREIDLSGGTRYVDEVFIVGCLELTSIVWPEKPTMIKRLIIAQAEELTKLDLLKLPELEELVILGCQSLNDIVGLGTNIKKINIDGTILTTIKLPHPENIEVLNIHTDAPSFTLKLNKLALLNQFSLIVPNANASSSTNICHLNNCPELEIMQIDTGNNNLDFNISNSDKLTKALIKCGANSVVKGLPDKAQFEFIEITKGDSKILDHHAAQSSMKTDDIRMQFELYKSDVFHFTEHLDDIETIIHQKGAKKENERQSMALIHLMGVPEISFTPGLRKERYDTDEGNKRPEQKKLPDEADFDALIPEIDRQREALSVLLQQADLSVISMTGITEPEQSIFIPATPYSHCRSGNDVIDWVRHTNKNTHPVLIIDQATFNVPDVQEVLQQQLTQKPVISPKHKIIFIGVPVPVALKAKAATIALTRFGYPQLMAYVGRLSGKAQLSPLQQQMISFTYQRLSSTTLAGVPLSALANIVRTLSPPELGSRLPSDKKATPLLFGERVLHQAVHKPTTVAREGIATHIYIPPENDDLSSVTRVSKSFDSKKKSATPPDDTGKVNEPSDPKNKRTKDPDDTGDAYESSNPKNKRTIDPDDTGPIDEPSEPGNKRTIDPEDTGNVEESSNPKNKRTIDPDDTGPIDEPSEPGNKRTIDPEDTGNVEESSDPMNTRTIDPDDTGSIDEPSEPGNKRTIDPEDTGNVEESSDPMNTRTIDPGDTGAIDEPSDPAKRKKTPDADLDDDEELGNFNEPEPSPEEYDEATISPRVKHESTQDLIHAASELAKAIQALLRVHQQSLGEDETMIAPSSELLFLQAKNMTYSIQRRLTSPEAVRDQSSLLDAARKISSAIDNLRHVASGSISKEEVPVLKSVYDAFTTELVAKKSEPNNPVKTELDTIYKPILENKPDKTTAVSNRQHMIDALTEIKNKYGAASGIMFKTGYKAGVNQARLKIITDLIHALKHNEVISPETLNAGLKELGKDKELAVKLKPLVDELKILFSAESGLKNKPSSKSEK